MKNKRLKEISKELDYLEEKHLSELRKERNEIMEKEHNEEFERIVGKAFIYKDNSYGDENKWNTYRKIIKNKNKVVKSISCEKTSMGIEIKMDNLWSPNMIGWEECSTEEFEAEYNKLQKELEEELK